MNLDRWIAVNRFDADYLPVLESKLFFEGDAVLRSITNYVVLLVLAAVIATYGLMSASAATVIGAMIVAPLMTPIMATTVAMVLGDGRRAVRSLAIVGGSMVAVVALAGLLSQGVSPYLIDYDANPELAARVAPNILALFVALASGAAGAFAISRADVGDSLPGVAIAISLVPPLCVVGIELAGGRTEDALGALLLFVTNFLAIVLAGGGVLWLSGLRGAVYGQSAAVVRKRGFVLALAATAVVATLLVVSGAEAVNQQRDADAARAAVGVWLAGAPYQVAYLAVHPHEVTVTIAGSGDLASVADLAATLRAALGREVGVELRVVAQQIEQVPAPAPGGG
jgi:uncharacterized hydrophobic protein (TIGR00271 family)